MEDGKKVSMVRAMHFTISPYLLLSEAPKTSFRFSEYRPYPDFCPQDWENR